MVIIMVRRDPIALGKIASLTLCVVDSRQEEFIYQADIDEFLAGYGAESTSLAKRPVVLKPVKGGFKDSLGEVSRNEDEK
jgi:hypothetical protein